MDHGRPHYNARIQDSANIIPVEEPVFLLRASDPFAARTVDYWISQMIEARGGSSDSELIAGLQAHAEAMREWFREHHEGRVLPDAPGDETAAGRPRRRWFARVLTLLGGGAHEPVELFPMFDSIEARDGYLAELDANPDSGRILEYGPCEGKP